MDINLAAVTWIALAAFAGVAGCWIVKYLDI